MSENNEVTSQSEKIFFQWDLTQSPEENFIDDQLWKVRTGLNEETLCGAIETIIFLSDKPQSITAIKDAIDSELPLRLVHTAIERLQEEYEQKHHGIRLMEVAQGYQFRTKATYAQFVKDVFKVQAISLTPLALEVLAMVAYKQPVSKSEIDDMRGVDSGHLIRGLMDKRLVRVIGRSDELGKSVLYGTTQEFLEVFNLNDLDQLPPMMELEELAKEQSATKMSDVKNIVHKDSQVQFKFDDFEELNHLSDQIKEIKTHTDFTKQLNAPDKPAKQQTSEQPEGSGEKKSAFDVLEEFLAASADDEQAQIAEGDAEQWESVDLMNSLEEASQKLSQHEDEEVSDFEELGEDEVDEDKEQKTPALLGDEEELGHLLDQAFEDLTLDKERSQD